MLTCNMSGMPGAFLTHTGIMSFTGGAAGTEKKCILDSINSFLKHPENMAGLENAKTIENNLCRKDILYSKRANSFCHQRLRNAEAVLDKQPLPFPEVSIMPVTVTDVSIRNTHSREVNFVKWVEYRRGAKQAVLGKCFNTVEKKCSSSKLLVYKALRISMVEVEAMLERDPDLYVLYTTRDPRNIMDSAVRKRFISSYSQKNSVKEAELLCLKMDRDLEVFAQLRRKYPSALKHITYEQLVKDSPATVADIYDFLELPVPPTVLSTLSRQVKNKGKSYKNEQERKQMSQKCANVFAKLNMTVV